MSRQQADWFWPRFSSFLLGSWCTGLAILIFLIEIRGVDGVIAEKSVSYSDFATILLTTVAVILAVMTIGLAFFAFIGYQNIREQAKESADNAAREHLASALKKGSEFRQHVDEKLEEIDRNRPLAASSKASKNADREQEADFEDENDPEFDYPNEANEE